MSISGDAPENPGLEYEIEHMDEVFDEDTCIHGYMVCEECAYDRGFNAGYAAAIDPRNR